MKENEFMELFDLLSDQNYQTSSSLALTLNVSERTIRNKITNFSKLLRDNGAHIISKSKKGYLLVIDDKDKLKNFIDEARKAQRHSSQIPVTSEERIQYLLKYLLANDDYVKLDDLGDCLFVSKRSLTSDLKEVRALLEAFNLKLIHKPNYGIKVKGKEFDLRRCIAHHTFNRVNFANELNDPHDQNSQLKRIGIYVSKALDKAKFRISDVAFQNLIGHIYIAIKRIQNNCYVFLNDNQMEMIKREKEYGVATDIVKELEKNFKFIFPEYEVGYIAIHLASKKIVDIENDGSSNFVISSEINDIVTHMLNEVYDFFKLDFRDDLELRMGMSLHLVPLGVRVKYDMIMRNPLLKEIKTKDTLAYTIAVQACEVLKRYYQKDIPEDEMGYFALYFSLALEHKENKIAKKNILIVCSSGRGSSQLLVYKFQQKFDKYLDKIETCEVYNLHKMDFANIDYVITTIPIGCRVPVPILEVKYFLEDSDVRAVKNLLSKEKTNSISNYFDKRLFLVDIDLKTKEEILKYMSKKIIEIKEVPRNFYSAVIKRENQALTEFGNLIAVPHPYKAIGKETFVCVAVLKKPIVWAKQKVQVIFLVTIENSGNKNLQHFYQMISKLLLNQAYIAELIKTKDYAVLMQLLGTIEQDMGGETDG